MIYKYILKPIHAPGTPQNDVKLICSYYDTELKRTTALLSNFEITQATLKPDDVVHSFRFSKQNFEINLSINEDLQGFEKPRRMIEHLEKHPQVKCDHIPNKVLQTEMFELINITRSILTNYDKLLLKNEIYNKVLPMSIEQLEHLVYTFGGTPTGKIREEIIMELLNYETGLLMLNPNKFLSSLNNNDEDIRGNVNKAIELKVIEKKDLLYYLNDQVIGHSSDECILYFKNNPQVYDKYILPKIGELSSTKYRKNHSSTKVKQ